MDTNDFKNRVNVDINLKTDPNTIPPPVVGDFFKELADGVAEIVAGEGIKGDKGDKGDTGAQGTPGATGATGATGARGATGATGIKGDTGAAGVKGDKGDKGDQGEQGITGDPGAIIVAGDAANVLNGTVNPTNDIGDNDDFYINTTTDRLFGPKTAGAWPEIGILLKGDKGDTGDSGAPGLNGDKGDKGDTGDTGAQGIQGIQGVKGDKGDTGDVGATGAQGIQGIKGDKGDKGDTGNNGLGVPAGGATGYALLKASAADNDTYWGAVSGGGGGTPGGSNTQIQFNNSGAFGGSSKLLWDGSKLNINNAGLYLGAGSFDPAAIVQLDSTEKGFLMPRMTQAQRIAIASPPVGLQVYQTDAGTFGEGLYQYKSGGWVSSSAAVGGSDKQIQFNGGGAFSGTSNFTYNYTTLEFYVKIHNYGGYIIEAPAHPTFVFRNGINGDYAYLGGGQSSQYPDTRDISIIGSHAISLEGAIVALVSGDIRLSSHITVGNPSGTGQGQWEFYGGGHFLLSCNYQQTAGSGGYNFQWQDSQNHFTTPQKASDIIVTTNDVRWVYNGHGGADNNLGLFMAIDHKNNMLILTNGGNSAGLVEDLSCVLQVDCTTRGIGFPKMTTTQKNAISSPRAGLHVYDTTLNQTSYYNGTTWINI